jgi:ketosteroid isomerase-like protein
MTNRSEIEQLLERRVDACEAKDLDRLMALYHPGIVYYDVVLPRQFTGSDEVRGNFKRWFDEYDGPISLETHDLHVEAGADLAFAYMLHVDDGARKTGLEGAVWIQSTVCCRRTDGEWLITHEHISLPGTWPQA